MHVPTAVIAFQVVDIHIFEVISKVLCAIFSILKSFQTIDLKIYTFSNCKQSIQSLIKRKRERERERR